MLWIIVDRESWSRMSDDQDGCEWVNVSSGTAYRVVPDQRAVKRLCVCVCVFGWQLPSKWCGAVLLLLLADAADTEVFIVHITRDVLQIMQVSAAVQHIQHWHTLKYCHTRDTHVKAAKNYYTRAYFDNSSLPFYHFRIIFRWIRVSPFFFFQQKGNLPDRMCKCAQRNYC